MNDHKAELKRWTRLLTLPLARLEAPPAGVEAHAGKGFHVLLRHADGGRFLHVVVRPASVVGEAASYHSSATASMRYHGGDDVLGPEDRAWLESMARSLDDLERQAGWSAFLAEAERRPAPALPSAAFDPEGELAPGNAELLRVTTRCNAHCSFCSARGVLEDLVEDEALIRRRLSHLRREGLGMVSFTGGEPTLLPGLSGLVRTAREQGFAGVDLQTNGILLAREEVLGPLVDAGLTSVFLSLHSAEAAVHDGLLDVPGAFDKAVHAAALCLRAGLTVRYNCVLTSRNLAGAADLARFIGERLPAPDSQINLSFVALQGWALDQPGLVPRLADAAPRMREAIDAGRSLDLEMRVPGLCGVPICILPGYEEHFDEYHATEAPRLADRRYAPDCRSCRWYRRCSGFWSVYLDRFGTDELDPREG